MYGKNVVNCIYFVSNFRFVCILYVEYDVHLEIDTFVGSMYVRYAYVRMYLNMAITICIIKK